MKYLYFFLILALPFGQLQKIPLSDYIPTGINIYLSDFIALIIFLTLLTSLIKRRLKIPPLGKYFLAFFLVALSSLIANYYWLGKESFTVSSLYLIRLAAYGSIYFSFFQNYSLPKPSLMIFLLYLSGTALAILGLSQFLLYPDLRPLKIQGWDPHLYRVTGTFLDPDFSGLFLALAAFIFLERITSKKKDIKFSLKTTSVFLFFLLIYSALILTFSRASYLTFTAGAAVICFFHKKLLIFAGLIIISSLFVFISSSFISQKIGGAGSNIKRTSTIKSRIEADRRAVKVFTKKPFLGIGFNSYRYAQEKFLSVKVNPLNHSRSSPPSSLLLILVTTGLVGIIIFAILVIKIFSPEEYRYPVLTLASLIAVAVHSLFSNSLFYPAIMAWLALLLGTTKILIKDDKKL